MMSVDFFLALGAFVTTIASAIGKAPVWVPVLLLTLIHLLAALPR